MGGRECLWAAYLNDFSMVRWLVEQGTDITIANKYGDRPYTVAEQKKNQEMADYLLLWSPKNKKLWYLDIEHEEFIADPGKYLNGMIEGEFEE